MTATQQQREWLQGRVHLQSISLRPVLLVIGERAHSRYFSEDVYEAAADSKEFYVIPDAGHLDLYDKTDLIPFEKLADFFGSGR